MRFSQQRQKEGGAVFPLPPPPPQVIPDIASGVRIINIKENMYVRFLLFVCLLSSITTFLDANPLRTIMLLRILPLPLEHERRRGT